MSATSQFFVLVDYGPKLGRSWIERDDARCDWTSTIEDIATGQIENMIEVRRAEDWADVTEEVARAVADRWAHDGEPLSYERYSFVEQMLGTRAARGFLRA